VSDFSVTSHPLLPCPVAITAFQLLIIFPHRGRVPGIVAGNLCDAIPVAVRRVHGNQGVVGSAAAEGAGARIENPVLARHEFRVTLLLLLVAVMANVIIPSKGLILGREAIEAGHRVVEAVLIPARFHQQNLESCLRKVGGERPATGAGTHDYIIELSTIVHYSLPLTASLLCAADNRHVHRSIHVNSCRILHLQGE
jgi:hypothetical protein